MAEYLIQDTTLAAIADAIRLKTGKTEAIPVSDMANEISNISVDGGDVVLRYITFMSYDGTVEYGKKAVVYGDDCGDPVTFGLFDTPIRESTQQYDFTFAGWASEPNGGMNANILKDVRSNKTVYANFISTVRYYTIYFYDNDGTTLLTTKSVAYGSLPSYIPTKDGASFGGWVPELTEVTGNASYTAQWTEKVTFANSSWADIARISEAGNASEYFKVGETRTIAFNGESLQIAIADFNHDDLVDGSGKAGITCVTVKAPSTLTSEWQTSKFQIYSKSLLHSNLQSWVSKLPTELQSVIKSVNKPCDSDGSSGTQTPVDVSCKLFPLSTAELGCVAAVESQYTMLGEHYPYYTAQTSGFKAPKIAKNGTSTYVDYWTRSIQRPGSVRPIKVSSSGSYGSVSSADYNAYYVPFGFCI